MDAQRAYYGIVQFDDDPQPTKTFRDEIAMAALQMKHVQDYGAMTAKDMANRAYEIADAMLAARTKES